MLSENRHAGDFIVSEGNNTYSRELGVFAENQTALSGQVLGRIKAQLEASSAAKAGGNTGGGSLTLDVTTPVLSGAKLGVYAVRCTAAASNSGTFLVTDPDGFEIGSVVVGATFANDIKFALADVGTDFAVGDGFDVTVVEDDDAEDIGQYVVLAPSATDGSEVAAGLLYAEATTAEGETAEIVLIKRHAEVDAAALAWPEGITTDQKAAATRQLAALGIVLR